MHYKKRASRRGDSPNKATRLAASRAVAGGNLLVMPKLLAIPRRDGASGHSGARDSASPESTQLLF
jgi:hypothetical protein